MARHLLIKCPTTTTSYLMSKYPAILRSAEEDNSVWWFHANICKHISTHMHRLWCWWWWKFPSQCKFMQKCFYRHRQKIYSNIRGRKLAEKYTTFSFKTSTKMGEKSQVRKIAQQIKKMEQHFNETSERRNCEKKPLTKSGKVRKKHKPQRKVRKNGKSGRVAAASLPSLLSSLDPFSLPDSRVIIIITIILIITSVIQKSLWWNIPLSIVVLVLVKLLHFLYEGQRSPSIYSLYFPICAVCGTFMGILGLCWDL